MAGEAVLVQPAGGVWGQIGSDIAPGRPPENLTCSANEFGSDTASFTIHRDSALGFNDLLPGCPVDIIRHGLLGWSGRIEEVSGDDEAGTQTVQCKGWQYHLDDDLLRPFYVHRDLTAWKDWRSNLAADLTNFTTPWQVEAGEGGIKFSVTTAPSAGWKGAMAYIDLGPGSAAKRVVIEWEKNVWAATANAYLCFTSTLAGLDARAGATLISTLSAAGSSGTHAQTLSPGYRYIGIYCDYNSAQADDRFFRVKAVRLFGETAWESSNDSALTFDKVAKAVLASGALPLLQSSDDRIDTFAFNVPEYAPGARQTPREILTAIQNYHDGVVQVDVDRKLRIALRPSAPIYEVGAWSQHNFKDGSTAREPVVSGVFVEGTGADGGLLEDVVNAADSLPQRQGYNKRKSIPIESSVTTALITQLGGVYVNTHSTSPFKGEQQVQGYGDVRNVLSGQPVHPFEMLTKTEEMMRFGDRIDPDTGGIGRDGRIKSVSYNAETEEGSVTIDNESRKFEALAGRVAAMTK